MSKQAEALRLAEWLDRATHADAPLDKDLAAELRRQHALIEELREALKEYIDAADFSMSGEDDVAAMLRFGDADKAARAALAKAEAQS